VSVFSGSEDDDGGTISDEEEGCSLVGVAKILIGPEPGGWTAAEVSPAV
jgi:hypothetical protein